MCPFVYVIQYCIGSEQVQFKIYVDFFTNLIARAMDGPLLKIKSIVIYIQ
jgi:hypothetical protein